MDPSLSFFPSGEKLVLVRERAEAHFYEPLVPKLRIVVRAGKMDQNGHQFAIHQYHSALFIVGADSNSNRLPRDFYHRRSGYSRI
jgi:hypothetical protein